MNEDEIVKTLEDRGIILHGDVTGTHFRYASGKHGDDYINKNALLANTALAGQFAHEMCMGWMDYSDAFPHVIVGPAMSGAILAALVAQEFGKVPDFTEDGDDTVYSAFVEKDPATRLFKLGRNYDKVVRGRNVLIVEDVINTGGTAQAAAHATMMAGGTVIGVAVIWNRGTSDKLFLPDAGGGTMSLPINALVHRPFPSFTEAECAERGPCSRGIPLDLNFGHAAAFLAKEREEA
jgi:orotate phosphoribosyltransferase